MSILINKKSRIVVQGITGRSGLFHTQQCRAYGSNIVAGVTPGKGGIHIEGIPVFNTVAEAFKIILQDHDVKGIFVNIFGGIMRCDVIALGIIEAAGEVNCTLPIVVRMDGSQVEEGRRLLAESGLNVQSAGSLGDGAARIVAMLAA